MISAVDLLPTMLDIAGIEPPQGFDGRSFAPTLRGESQSGRGVVYKVYNENSGGNRSPMRSVQSKRFGYLFNPWSDGKRIFKTATTGTMSYRAMEKMAPSDEHIAARLELFRHGVPEEFYDYENDPDALYNLIDDPRFADEIKKHRAVMRKFMIESKDHALEAFDNRDNPKWVAAYVDRVQAESDARRAGKRNAGPTARTKGKPKPNPKLFRMRLPAEGIAGEAFTVTILHRLPKTLGEQPFQVTLKDSAGARIERIVRSASGEGTMDVTFTLPQTIPGSSISVAAFVGEEFAKNLLYRTENDIKVSARR
jgi:N-sulfoglucosamine sulfohydrolase